MTVPRETLRTEINAILKDADLSTTSAKKVRLQLEEKFSCDFSSRRKEIDELVMDFVNSKDDSEEEEDESESEKSSEEEQKPSKKRSSSSKSKPAKKKKKNSSDEEDSDDEEYGAKKKAGKSKGSDSESGGEWKKPKKAAKTKKTGTGKSKGTGFTRPYTLSPALANLMGAEALPRHEVVKKVWSIIKERNLYDPKNKQYAVCDADLQKVMGVKRFRTFGMLKYLKTHFLD